MPFIPSNSSEGDSLLIFCESCKHEKFMHTQNHNDAQCPILNKIYLGEEQTEIFEDEFGSVCCSNFSLWEWYDNNGNFQLPPEPQPKVENQLSLFEVFL